MSTAATPQPPLTFRGISPLDGIRVRWAGSALVILGVVLFFQGVAGVIFGILFFALGVAVWGLTHFGHYNWYDLSPASRWVVGSGAVSGFLLAEVFLLCSLFAARAVQFVARMF